MVFNPARGAVAAFLMLSHRDPLFGRECWFLGPVSELPVGGIRKPAYSGAGCEYSEPGENLGTVACNPVNTSESNEGGQ